jgi:hypothetical protein
VDRGANPDVRRTAADVAGHARVDIGIGWAANLGQQAIADMIWPDWQ